MFLLRLRAFLCSLDCSCFVLLWINGLKSMGAIGDKIFSKEIQVKMLPIRNSISGMSSLLLFVCIWIYS